LIAWSLDYLRIGIFAVSVNPALTTDVETHDAPRKQLIVRARNFIGDVVLLLPALERLHAAGYELTLVGKPWLKSLIDAYGWSVHSYPKKYLERVKLLKSLAVTAQSKDATFRNHINAITFATSFSSALDMRSAGLKAYGYAVEGRSILLAAHAKIVYGEHALNSYWRLTNGLLGSTLPPPPSVNLRTSAAAEDAAKAALQSAGVREHYIVLVPFAGGTFEKLGKKWGGFPALVERFGCINHDLVLAPGPDEEADARARFPTAKILSRLPLNAYCAILRDAALTIANDTGPGHMAASVNGKLLSVLGPTKVEQWGARGSHVRIVQSYPEWPSVEDVATAAQAMLSVAP
jgi:heptosyltransferase II